MVKKRSVFDIDFVPDEDEEAPAAPQGLETKSFYNVQGHPLQNMGPIPDTPRRGPMASAIHETAEANQSRAQAEAAIRAENDMLAHEHVRLKKLGLITDLIDTGAIAMKKLTRDRAGGADPDLGELKASIQSIGLSNPIRVEQTDDGYELIQGFRRLTAFRELAQETGDKRFERIPATLVPRGEPLVGLYRKMVDENLVRKDISFGEMATLALSYARDSGVDTDAAVRELYASALKQKRSYIRQFVRLLDMLDGSLNHPEAIPRALGLELAKVLEGAPERVAELRKTLARFPAGNPEEEVKVLRAAVAAKPAKPQRSVPKATAKTSMRLSRPEGEARVLASDGRIELRLPRDFSAVSRARLQTGIEALLKALDEE
ncbi:MULTISPECIES: ParB/RepB/Spo0J family partition protein [unclassified Sulfitobacter]|uniref:ParB/RepB/Spo0J family partition protein n=1 Tax=unclassified Sulfitobacter TaxID=196795 RepID=UPI0007C31244|nr:MULTISPECIES: ParB N-terminal domain-containing protein [unclassified Sulfitobacter]KZY04414.1 replication protein [Sulfitobacter sp. HI0023]KZY24722.1 replication protein [Sulfitobacter sp. HI0040]KZZ66338.1 replication protein [Sulfitobacter sp. HI0129]